MRVVLTRHGATGGNQSRRYIGGASDEGLCREGILQLGSRPKRPGVPRVYTSGLLRTRQTAAILYPDAAQVEEYDLREMEFGSFEGRSYAELADDPPYRAWVAGGCAGRCPGGESRGAFVRRCRAAFRRILTAEAEARELHLVVHGGTIMALLSSFAQPPRDYFSITTPPGASWICRWRENALLIQKAPEEERT